MPMLLVPEFPSELVLADPALVADADAGVAATRERLWRQVHAWSERTVGGVVVTEYTAAGGVRVYRESVG